MLKYILVIILCFTTGCSRQQPATLEPQVLEDNMLLRGSTFWSLSDKNIKEFDDKYQFDYGSFYLEPYASSEYDLMYKHFLYRLVEYCGMNRIDFNDIKLSDIEYDEGNDIVDVEIRTAGMRFRGSYSLTHHMSRIDYLEGASKIDSFGVPADSLTSDEKLLYSNALSFIGLSGSLYSVKEKKCCYYIFYVDKENKCWVKLDKETLVVEHDGIFDDSGNLYYRDEYVLKEVK